MSSLTTTQPGLAIGRGAARPPRHVSAALSPRVADAPSRSIEAALDRISNGQYGRCEQCRDSVSAALLARQPQARYRTACACLALPRAGQTGWPAKPI
jgi:hypothetical protein